MFKTVQFEICLEFCVDAGQQVQIELRGDIVPVVIGRIQYR